MKLEYDRFSGTIEEIAEEALANLVEHGCYRSESIERIEVSDGVVTVFLKADAHSRQ